MKKNTPKILMTTVIALTLLALPLASLANGFILPSVFDKTFLGELKEKIKRLKDTPGKRIVFIGGSALAFGLDSELIQKHLPQYSVVNFGMYASLGSNVMLDLSLENIHEGDIVVFCPEIDVQTLSMYYNGDSLWQALDGDFSSLSLLEESTKEQLWGDFYHFSSQKFRYTFLDSLVPDGIYQKASFNEYGDIKKELRPNNVMPGLQEGTREIVFDTDQLAPDFISYVNDYATQVRKKKASLYFGFVPMNRKSIRDEDDVHPFYDFLEEQFNFEMLGNPMDSLMDAEWFFDTDFHLNGAGSIVYTKSLIEQLKIVLNDLSKTDIDLPEKPTPSESPDDDDDGDNSDESAFAYEDVEGGCQVTQVLSANPRLTIPYRHDGKKVVGFDVQCFQKNDFLEELTIQSNIRKINDFSFEGSEKLTKIHLANPSPSSIIVGAYLLNGTNANLYVPKNALGSYVTDYKFSQYASRIFSE